MPKHSHADKYNSTGKHCPIEKYLEIRDSKLHYTRNGPNSEVAICFLPGWGGSRWVWDYFADYWSATMTTLNIDFPGFGHSALPSGIRTAEQMAKDVALIFEKEKIKRCIFVGHSFGGLLALLIAELKKDQVIAVIGADSFIHMDLYPAQPPETVNGFLDPVRKNFQGALLELGASYLTADCHPALRATVLREFRSCPADQSADILGMFLSCDMSAALENYHGMVASIVDGNKFNVEKDRFEALFSSRIDVIAVENSNHFLMLEDPEKFNALLSSLIKKIGSF